tara:strand:+ start:188 stop:421 length:234 start_codon:yes stop_codon:yes gene_type:complete
MSREDRLARRELKTYGRYKKAKEAGKSKKAGRLYDKLVDRQTKSIKAGVNVNYDDNEYRHGGSVKWTRNTSKSGRCL